MNTHHHPDDSTLLSYAAGSLPANASLLVSCHLQFCGSCRATIRDGETIGGAMFGDMPDTRLPKTARESIVARLRDDDIQVPVKKQPSWSPDELPLPLQPLVGKRYEELDWSPLVPGVGQIKLDSPGGKLRLLNISPGTCLPMHSHRDSELTLVLKGSYTDEIGRFGIGDVADLDPSVEHQPIVDSQVPCISLVVSDAPLKFRGIVPRMLQPFFGI